MVFSLMDSAPLYGVVASGADDGSLLATRKVSGPRKARKVSGTRKARIRLCGERTKLNTPNGVQVLRTDGTWSWGRILSLRDLSPTHATPEELCLSMVVQVCEGTPDMRYKTVVYLKERLVTSTTFRRKTGTRRVAIRNGSRKWERVVDLIIRTAHGSFPRQYVPMQHCLARPHLLLSVYPMFQDRHHANSNHRVRRQLRQCDARYHT